jgi:hypothetical protein
MKSKTYDAIVLFATTALLVTPNFYHTNSLLLLSDLPTPSFIIDLQALRRVAEPPFKDGELPSIRCPKNNLLLQPLPISNNNSIITNCNFPIVEGQPAIGYLHSTVTRSRDDVIHGEDDPISTFLAEVDLDPTLCCCGGNGAHLVLGLNNHHVGSYYWARSAGAGSSMEAPGVCYGSSKSNSKGVLRWLDENGPTACNSNDGKRSEWVNFLRKQDTVQLLPKDGQDTLMEFHKRYRKSSLSSCNDSEGMAAAGGTSTRIFGISNEGRPMGSEPKVVCEYGGVL